MVVSWTLAVAVVGFAAVLVAAVTLIVRAADRRAAARDRAILTALEQLQGKVAQIGAAAEQAKHKEAPALPGAVKIAGEEVTLSAEMIARIEAVADKSSDHGGIDALYAALALGLEIAEHGFAEPAKPQEEGEPPSGRVVPLRPRDKPPGDKGGGAA
jgi:hypothetical protein